MSNDLVTLATYRFAPKAEMARTFLEQAGIQAFVADMNAVNADWFLGNAIGYIKLQVPESQVEAALAILQEHPQMLDGPAPTTSDETDEAVCLSCGELLPDDADRCPSCGWSYGDEK